MAPEHCPGSIQGCDIAATSPVTFPPRLQGRYARGEPERPMLRHGLCWSFAAANGAPEASWMFPGVSLWGSEASSPRAWGCLGPTSHPRNQHRLPESHPKPRRSVDRRYPESQTPALTPGLQLHPLHLEEPVTVSVAHELCLASVELGQPRVLKHSSLFLNVAPFPCCPPTLSCIFA